MTILKKQETNYSAIEKKLLVQKKAILNSADLSPSKKEKKLRKIEEKISLNSASEFENKLSKEESFFKSERKQLRVMSIVIFTFIAMVTMYFVITIIIPFFNIKRLMESVPYFGWPLLAVLFLFIWVPSLFLSKGLLNKNKFSDYQMILERKSINKYFIFLAPATLFFSLFGLIITRNFKQTKRFNDFKKNQDSAGTIWLSDMRPMSAKESASLGLAYLVVILWSLVLIYPIYQLIKQTFNGNLNFLLSQTDHYAFSFKHFGRLFKNYPYMTWMGNTLLIAVITMAIVVLLSSFAAYIYSRNRFKTKKGTLLLIMTLGLIPAAAGLSAYYVLSVIMKGGLGLSGKWLLIFLYAGGGTIGNIFVLKGYLDNISTEIDEAAQIDGLSKGKTFFKVILPLLKPMIAISAIGAFVGPFGDFILPGLLFDQTKDFTLAQGLQSLVAGTSADETAFAAGAIIIAVPITVIIMVSQTLLTKGSTAGGVKG